MARMQVRVHPHGALKLVKMGQEKTVKQRLIRSQSLAARTPFTCFIRFIPYSSSVFTPFPILLG